MAAPVEIFLDVADPRLAHAMAERPSYTFEREGAFYVLRKRFERAGYQLELFREGSTVRGSCSCPDFQFRGAERGNPCKHLWIAAEFLGFVSFPPTPAIGEVPPPTVEGPKRSSGDGGSPPAG